MLKKYGGEVVVVSVRWSTAAAVVVGMVVVECVGGGGDGDIVFNDLDLLEYFSFISSACRRTYSNHTAEDDIEVFSTEDPGLDWISAHNFPTRLQKLSSNTFGHLEVSESVAFASQTDTPETDKNEYTSLLKDLLSHLGYSVGRDDIINIDSLRKHPSL
ncbi:hypothetical protein Tco_0151850 [Tanacetum coccineum]